jgi:hypothetical protein
MKVIKDTGPLVAFDGCEGMGHYQAYKASELAAEKAKEFGISLISVANSNHCGVRGPANPQRPRPLGERGPRGPVAGGGDARGRPGAAATPPLPGRASSRVGYPCRP